MGGVVDILNPSLPRGGAELSETRDPRGLQDLSHTIAKFILNVGSNLEEVIQMALKNADAEIRSRGENVSEKLKAGIIDAGLKGVPFSSIRAIDLMNPDQTENQRAGRVVLIQGVVDKIRTALTKELLSDADA